jgi:hypothetical protein
MAFAPSGAGGSPGIHVDTLRLALGPTKLLSFERPAATLEVAFGFQAGGRDLSARTLKTP